MRKTRDFQTPLSSPWLELEHAKELQALSGLIDDHPKISELVLQDLTEEETQNTGAQGIPSDLVFRALLLKQMNAWTYDELHFHLCDSQTYRAFCGLGMVYEYGIARVYRLRYERRSAPPSRPQL